MTINDIARLCKESKLRWTNHILKRIFQRNIRISDVKSALLKGEIIEQYPDDFPSSSCLVLGYAEAGDPLHIVCGSNGDELWLITAYYPSLSEWTEGYKQRRQR